jgi:O-antigen/teichoic acid export membrane protein
MGLAAVVLVAFGKGAADLRPRWPRAYLRRAAGFGAQVQLSYVAISLAARFDLVLVYALASHAGAGRYSIALTLAITIAYAGQAIVYAGFPRVAASSAGERLALTARMFRVGVLAALIGAVVLGSFTSRLVPAVFGSAYHGAIGATVLLLPGGVAYSGQFILARALAAWGHPRLLAVSFTVSVVVMAGLDVALIPLLGIIGAAIASSISSIVGLMICVRAFRRETRGLGRDEVGLVPRLTDLRDILSVPRRVVDTGRGRIPRR